MKSLPFHPTKEKRVIVNFCRVTGVSQPSVVCDTPRVDCETAGSCDSWHTEGGLQPVVCLDTVAGNLDLDACCDTPPCVHK